jgi:DNA repair protein RecN (Recombination protein N)
VCSATALQEIESSVSEYAAEIEADPSELGQLEERLRLFQNLKRKYGATLQAVLDHKEDAETQLARIENRGDEIEKLRGRVAEAEGAVIKLGESMSKKRAAAAPKLAEAVAAHLADLGFKRSVFEVKLNRLETPGRHGLEEADFHFAPNPGEPLKPLRLTASSGEMSRVLLAVKSALAKQDAVPLLVFDEIDANVGGNIAEAVGRKMAALGETHQVIAITHFPQVASLSQSHFVVTKEVGDDRTRSRIQRVDEDDRVDELARMLGGSADSARAHAQSLLAGAAN